MSTATLIRGCPDCGAMQSAPSVLHAATLRCAICHSELERVTGRSITAAFAFASAAFLLLFPANFLPFLTTSLLGVTRQSLLVSSASAMLNEGWPELAIVIGLFVVVLPFARFGLLTAVLGCLQFGRRPGWLGRAFRYANMLQVWAMPDVFLLGLAVAYARLKASIAVEVGLGALCFIAVGLLALFTRATLNKSEVWRAIAEDTHSTASEAAVLTCTGCDLVLPAEHEGHPCPRCAVTLRLRKPEAIGRALALSLAGILLYLPANLYPIATLPIDLKPIKYTVLEGVIDLTQAKLVGLALLVFSASFAIPILKLLGLSWCIVSVVRRSDTHLRKKTMLYRVVEELGRWSMVDPFVIGCFVPVMSYNAFIYGRAEAAAPAFTAVVIVTIVAARCFDPRLMWDAARRPQ